MSTLHISLFGKLDIKHGEQPIVDIKATKAQELLAYLLLYRDHPHTREKLATLLWENSSPSQSKSYLRQILWELQSALEDEIALLQVDLDWLQINNESDFWLDVACFEQAHSQGKGIQGRKLNETQASALRRGVALYKGDLLENWYQEWCLFERERLQNMYLAMLGKLVGYCEARRRFDAGTAYATKILRREPAHERTYRRLMRLQYVAGNRTAALRTYERCVNALDEELDIAPSRRTIALRKQIQFGRFSPMDATPVAELSLPTVLDRLLHLQGMLLQAQRQIEEEIQVVQTTLHEN